MDINDIIPFLAVVLVLVGVVAAAGLVTYLVLRLRAGERVSFPVRLLFRAYLYLISLVSVVIMVSGASALVQAGLGVALGKEFSYTPAYVPERPGPLKPDGIRDAPPVAVLEEAETARRRGLDRALKEGLLNGVSLSLVGAVAWGLHGWGRRRLETQEEREGLLPRVYQILLLVVFSVITLVTLPTALYDTLRYYLLGPVDDFSRSAHPGGRLATALVSLPVWVFYLNAAVRLVRRHGGRGDVPAGE